AGTLSAAYLDATLSRVNWFRAMAGVPSNVTFTAEQNALAQAAGVLQATRPDGTSFSHAPPNTWRCFSQAGFQGSQQSNLGGTGPGAIDGWLADMGGNNTATGHRRHMLASGQIRMGHGGVPDNAGALHVFGERTNPAPIARDTFVAWPNRGFVPYQVVWSRWSFLLPPSANVSAATVSMRRGATDIPVRIIERESNSGYGDSAINWQPSNIGDDSGWARPAADETYTVTVAGVVIDGAPRTFTYDVTIFDPAVADPTAARAVITGPERVAVGQPSTFTFTAVPQATSYELRSASVTPLAFTDGAEAGAANFDAVVDQYPVVSTIRAATGASSFRLTTGQPRRAGATDSRQTLTFRQLLLPGADGRLRFAGFANGLTNVDAVVEASVNGTDWTTVFRETATNDTAFAPRTVSLAAFAGQAIQLRFRAENAGTGGTACCGGEGWYLDDLAFDGVEAVAAPAVSAVPLGTTFTFTPATATDHLLQLRPVFFGTGPGDWGPVKRTSAAPPAVAPSITTQPAALTVTAPAAATLSVVATGTDPLTFAWRRNGVALVDGNGVAGASTASLTVTPAVAGSYDVVVSNRAGTVTSAAATVTVVAPPPAPTLADALDTTLVPRTAGNAPWTAQTAITRDGVDAAQSGRITADQSSRLELPVTGPATVSFSWRVSSELNFDFLNVSIDGAAPATTDRISGTVDWTTKTIT
ncbi:MAG: CAP domain-containing protein, partial [Acidimicrobiia bacterium]|nr:CAP domain-containing protein [Acidimicrobiia bacterium]